MQVVQEPSSNIRRENGGSQVAKMERVYDRIRLLVAENAMVMFTVSGCCMAHAVKQLLSGLGVAPTIFELDHDDAGREIHDFLFNLTRRSHYQPLPAVFIGGKFLGGVETVMACHVTGTLVPLLKNAGALWL